MIVKPGTVIETPADIPLPSGETVALPEIPAHTRRMCVQVVDGDESTVVRIREYGNFSGRGIVLILYGSRIYGGADGALAQLEAEHIAGADAAIAVQFERD
jgi:hypothetical protein